jgi:hypothetical protein
MVSKCGGLVKMTEMKINSWLLIMILMLMFISYPVVSVLITDINAFDYPVNIHQQTLCLDENYYTWEDDFFNAQKIDESYSENFIVDNGYVEMYGTFPQWTNAEWMRMKVITIENVELINDCVLKLIIHYDSDMKSDYSDIRFKFNNDDYWLPYWIEEINPEPNDPYVIVWVRIASLPLGQSYIYLFYGNPSASDQSDYWQVFDENSWENYYTHDHQVTYHMESEGAWDPDVIWGDNTFFVCWEEGIPRYLPLGMIFKQQIRGCFYSEDGEQIGNRFDITPWVSGSTNSFRCENPSGAFGEVGSEKHFFVCFEYYNNPNDPLSRDIKGAIVPTYTETIEDVTTFDICLSSGNQADPIVTYDDDNQRFFVVWEDGREGTNNYNIYGKLFDISGNSIGSEKIITDRPNSQCEPWVAYDDINNHFMIVWEEGIDPELGPFEIWGQLFTLNGDPLGDEKRLSPEGLAGTDYNFPCVAFCDLTERFLVAWQEDDLSNDQWYGHIWGKILDENGNTIIDTFKIANGAFERTNVVPHLSSSFFVVYDGGGDVWGNLVSSDGDVNPYVLQLTDGESEPADWANIDSSGEKIFVSWEDTRIIYIDPYDGLDLPDVFANVWSFNTPSSSDVSYTFGDEHSLVLQAYITSEQIMPENLESWHRFSANKTGSISFDIVDGTDPSLVLMRDVSSGMSLSSLPTQSIRLKALFERQDSSTSPKLDKWAVQYVGRDEDPPVTRVQDVEGVTGLNDWYISETVILWLIAEDYPEDTGSGIEGTYYTLNDGLTNEYNIASGIQLSVSQSSNWMNDWLVNFWSVDKTGNTENKEKAENYRRIKIDADKPHIEIISPANEEQVETPFWVQADASDNVDIDRVEFDIEPFGEREGLPYVDTEPPFEWYCDVEQENIGKTISYNSLGTLGVNLMLRAQVYDESGQTWIHEVWIYIKNWRDSIEYTSENCLIIGFASPFIKDKEQIITSTESLFTNSYFYPYIKYLGWEINQGLSYIISNQNKSYLVKNHHFGFASSFKGFLLFDYTFFIGYADYVKIRL